MIPRLHVVTDDEILARPDFETRAREVCEGFEVRESADGSIMGGSLAFHIRGPRTTGRRLTRPIHCATTQASTHQSKTTAN